MRFSRCGFCIPLIIAFAVLALSSRSHADDSPGNEVRQAILSHKLQTVTLYRGASSDKGFDSKALQGVKSEADLVQCIASRLMSSSPSVTGLSSSPRTAGSFALGVKDNNPDTIRITGLSTGFIGVTGAKLMKSSDFADLVGRFGKEPTSLNLLLEHLGKNRVVVDASNIVNVFSRRHPGILTQGYQEMIRSALGREAEYLAFGRTPTFKKVVSINKNDVINARGSVSGAIFNSKLSSVIDCAGDCRKPALTSSLSRKQPIKTTVARPSTSLPHKAGQAATSRRRPSRVKNLFRKIFRRR